MRTIPTRTELLMHGARSEHLRVSVYVPAPIDDFVSLSDLTLNKYNIDGEQIAQDFILGVETTQDIDSKITTATVVVARDDDGLSLAPLRSILGIDQFIWLNREIKIEVAIEAEEITEPPSWILLFEGKIDSISWEPEITITALDKAGAALRPTMIEENRTYGGMPTDLAPDYGAEDVEAVMGEILTDNGSALVLNVPTSPDWLVWIYPQEKLGLWQALENIVAQFGWCLEYRWDEALAPAAGFALTVYDPERDRAVDRTFTPSEYLSINSISVSLEEVRNAFACIFPDAYALLDADELGTSGEPVMKKIVYPDDLAAGPLKTALDASIAAYGRRYGEFIEASESLIDGEAKVASLLTAAALDLSEPKITKEVTLPLFPFVQLCDLYEFEANNVHSDTDLELAVVSIIHRFGGGQAETILGMRGKPAAFSQGWLDRIAAPGVGPNIRDFEEVIDYILPTTTPLIRAFEYGIQVDLLPWGIWYQLRRYVDRFEIHIGSGDFTPTPATLMAKGREQIYYLHGPQLDVASRTLKVRAVMLGGVSSTIFPLGSIDGPIVIPP